MLHDEVIVIPMLLIFVSVLFLIRRGHTKDIYLRGEKMNILQNCSPLNEQPLLRKKNILRTSHHPIVRLVPLWSIIHNLIVHKRIMVKKIKIFYHDLFFITCMHKKKHITLTIISYYMYNPLFFLAMLPYILLGV